MTREKLALWVLTTVSVEPSAEVSWDEMEEAFPKLSIPPLEDSFDDIKVWAAKLNLMALWNAWGNFCFAPAHLVASKEKEGWARI